LDKAERNAAVSRLQVDAFTPTFMRCAHHFSIILGVIFAFICGTSEGWRTQQESHMPYCCNAMRHFGHLACLRALGLIASVWAAVADNSAPQPIVSQVITTLWQ